MHDNSGVGMKITANHIKFYDARKLREAHAALLGSAARIHLGERFKADTPRRYLSKHEAPSPIDRPISIHRLIPEIDWRDVEGFKASKRACTRAAHGKDNHLTRNLAGFIESRMRREGESFTEALQHFAGGEGQAGQSKYARRTRRWLRAHERFELRQTIERNKADVAAMVERRALKAARRAAWAAHEAAQ